MRKRQKLNSIQTEKKTTLKLVSTGNNSVNHVTQEYWQTLFEKAKSSKNWGDLLEIGKNRLEVKDFKLAIDCLIESRHFNLQEPLTHKYLGDAYQCQADFLAKEKDLLNSSIYYEKAKNCYLSALDIANDNKNNHFLTEFGKEIKKQIKTLEKK